MIGKPIALIQIPNQAMFGPKAAAQYLGINVKTLKELTDLPSKRNELMIQTSKEDRAAKVQ